VDERYGDPHGSACVRARPRGRSLRGARSLLAAPDARGCSDGVACLSPTVRSRRTLCALTERAKHVAPEPSRQESGIPAAGGSDPRNEEIRNPPSLVLEEIAPRWG